MTDYKALCSELVDALQYHREQTRPIKRTAEILDRARAALAEPEPVNHWKEALIDALVVDFLLNEENSNDPKRAIHDLIKWNMQLAREPLLAEGAGVGPTDEELDALAGKHLEWTLTGHRAFARAVLARYDTTHPRPIPVVEQ